MAVALLVAAGRGERLGSEGPKAFVACAGRPLLEWSVAALQACPDVERIVVALPPGVVAPRTRDERLGPLRPKAFATAGGHEQRDRHLDGEAS